jgi:hypothetical protein
VMFSEIFWSVVRFANVVIVSICVAACVFGLLFGMFDFESRIEGQSRLAVAEAPHLKRRPGPL